MDEEDGRPGARAVKTGPLDATCSVRTESLQNDELQSAGPSTASAAGNSAPSKIPQNNRRSFNCVDRYTTPATNTHRWGPRIAINAAQDDELLSFYALPWAKPAGTTQDDNAAQEL